MKEPNCVCPKMRCVVFYISMTFLVINLSSCKKGSNSGPEPDPVTKNFWVQGTTNAESIKGYANGNLSPIITGNGSGISAPYKTNIISSTSLQSITLDSLVYSGTGKERQKFGTTILNDKGLTKNVTLNEISQAYKASIAGNTNADEVEGWKDNVKVLTSNGNGPYNTNEVEFTAETLTLDSLLYKGAKMGTLKEINVVLQPGTNNKDVTLDPSGSIVSGTITNIENSLGLSDAYVVAWDGNGSMIYVETDANGNFELPVDIDYNEIKIIKEGFQTRTIYEKTDQAITVDKDIFNTSTFPIDAIDEMTDGVNMHFINTPTVYILKDTDNYPASAYENSIRKLISDTDGMSLGNTSNLSIVDIANESELPALSDDNPYIAIKLVTGENSIYTMNLSTDGKHIRNASIRVHFIDEDQAYSSFSEEFGSVFLGARYPPNTSSIVSNYSANSTGFGASFYQVVDTLLSKFHWSRKNETVTRTDTEKLPQGFNKLDNSGELSNILLYNSTEGLVKKEYEQIPTIIKNNI